MPDTRPADAPVVERFVVMRCGEDDCLAVLSLPVLPTSSGVGVVIVVGGPQYRAGSHRQFVLMARALARTGIPCLRFDYRGMGDSDGSPRTFEQVGNDLSTAIDALQAEGGVERVVLWGLCDGASVALMDGVDDRRVAGIVALNPWARSPRGEASTRLRHYYLQRLLQPAFWRKLLSSGLQLRQRAGELAGAVRVASTSESELPATDFLRRMETGWKRFGGSLLLILSGNDYTAREFEAWVASSRDRRQLLKSNRVRVEHVPGADHTFSSRPWRDAVAGITIDWIRGLGHGQSRAGP